MSNKAPPLFTSIFIVYGKDSGLEVQDFRNSFKKFGTITNIHISRMNDKPKGVTYITFNKTSEACTAMENMDGEIICGLNRGIRVHLAHSKKDNLEIDVDQDNMLQRLCVRHPKHENEEDIERHFKQFGHLLRVHALTDKGTRENLGVAFVKFEKQSEAARAMEECDASYKPRWADVRKKAYDTDMDMMMSGFPNNGPGGFGPQSGQGYGMGMDSGQGYGMGMDAAGHGYVKRTTFGQGYGKGIDCGQEFGQGMDSGYSGGNHTTERPEPLLQRNNPSQNHTTERREPLLQRNNPSQGYGSAPMVEGGFGDDFEPGPTRVEAMVPPSLSRQQVYRIFDIAQGLENLSVNPDNGLVCVDYMNSKCAAHAKEKIDGLDVYGATIAVRFAKSNKRDLSKTAQQLKQTLAEFQGSGPTAPHNKAKLDTLMQSIQEVSEVLQGHGVDETVPWCNVPLPCVKPLLPKTTPQLGKLFVVTMPQAVANPMLVNAFRRFGDLIMCGYQPGKRFGFANYGTKEAASRAIQVLNGAYLAGNRVKVEFSRQETILPGEGHLQGEEGTPRKRQRQF